MLTILREYAGFCCIALFLRALRTAHLFSGSALFATTLPCLWAPGLAGSSVVLASLAASPSSSALSTPTAAPVLRGSG